jgi:hypothetical protein
VLGLPFGRRGLARFDTSVDLGRLGIVTRGDSLNSPTASFERHRLELVAWYGIRVFTDHLAAEPPGVDSELAVEAEWRAGQTDPYRRGRTPSAPDRPVPASRPRLSLRSS